MTVNNYKDIVINQKENEIEESKYENFLNEVREKTLIDFSEQIEKTINQNNRKETLIGFINKTIVTHFPNYINYNLGERLYNDIFGFGIIDQYLDDPRVEEINGNSWDDIEIITSKGFKKIEEKFSSPEQAQNIIKKMMRIGGKTLDEAHPSLDSHIGTGLRLTATIPPILDENIGVSFSLRKLGGRKITIKDLVEKYSSYSYEETDVIKTLLENGISMIFGGATGSGKSSDLQTFLDEIAADGIQRLFVIEEDTREMDFIYKEDGKTISRVIHTKTRPIENQNRETLNVDSVYLVKESLRYHADIIVPAEMRGKEAMSAQEVARTGHTVASTAHVSSVTEAYERILTLCLMSGTNLSEDMLMALIVKAFPIVVFKQQLKKEDMSRRCMKIFEATGYDKTQKKIRGRILYRFIKKAVEEENGFKKVYGVHRKIKPISFRLCQKLYENGCDLAKIKILNPEFTLREDIDYLEDYVPDED